MCALFLRRPKPAKFFLYVWFNKVFGKLQNLYDRGVGWMLRKPVMALLVFFIIIVKRQ